MNIAGLSHLLACPVCGGALGPIGSTGLKCPSGHSFDVSRQGYVNFLSKGAGKTDYGREMLKSRGAIFASGLFDGLIDALLPHIADGRVLLDAGCGEGSLLDRIAEKKNITGVGLDISKEGVRIAAGRRAGAAYCVGDLSRMPFRRGAFDTVLNVLSPGCYSEFGRVLKPGGVVIKAVPESGHLKEIRQALGKPAYQNDRVVGRFQEHLTLLHRERIGYTVPVPKEMRADLLNMTPLAWHGADLPPAISFATVDLSVLIGRLKTAESEG